jgi:predicted RNA methylase
MTQQLPLPAAAPADAPPLLCAAQRLAARLGSGGALTAAAVSQIMTETMGGSDAAGLWSWRQAYDACEAASIIALRRGAVGAMRRDPVALLTLARDIAGRTPSQTRRSEAQTRLNQFSTPLPYAMIAAAAAAPRAGETALEPSCGTGLLAVGLHVAGCRLVLNDIDPDRRLLAQAALAATVTGHDAEFIDDLLPGMLRPTLVVMNPPFSSTAARSGDAGIAGAHLLSALKRLAPGGRLVAIMPEGFSAEGSNAAAWAKAHVSATLRLRLVIDGAVYGRHGARVATSLVVFDKTGAESGPRDAIIGETRSLDEALALALALPRRADVASLDSAGPTASRPALAPRQKPARSPTPSTPSLFVRRETGQPLRYALRDAGQGDAASGDAAPGAADTVAGGLYAGYRVARIDIADAAAHPTPLVESAAMAAITPPAPHYRPVLPPSLVRRGVLSDAQLETIVQAGTAFETDLPGAFVIDADWRSARAATETEAGAVRLRRGFFLGDGTGCGKGRQVAGIILDRWMQGGRRAVWVSKSDKLLEDAVRDWTALGGDAADIRPLGRWKLGEDIALNEGIVFATYATLRVGPRQGKTGRLEQLVDWLGRGFDGVIAFDEAHAMGGAAASKSDRGERKGSQQGIAGLRLQLACPRARVLYVSATGATTLENLAYASRLGLWGIGDYPFQDRAAFITAMTAGGVAAMEVVARDLKALGLYVARALSFEGVEYEILEHPITERQRAVYDAYADAFQIIHRNLTAAMEATNITSDGACNDSAVKGAVRSRFESLKQRFFNHLLIGMKTPTMLDAVARALEDGHSAVIQLVSTGEALMDRRLDALAPGEHEDLSVDLTPREYVVEYLREAFPTELRQVCEDENGQPYTRVVTDEHGRPVQSREACALRDALIERLCLMEPVQTALDQILWRFGADAVAEATGRTRRIVRTIGPDKRTRLRVERRAGAANTAETQAFMGGAKRILVFSEAGGTGRSYHADRGAANRQRRVHFLLEAGWKADTAVQGLGRTHRSNQDSAPVFVPVTTDVRGERRFISTIARRLDSLGALTKGAARTGGQNLFRPEDSLESRFAKAALRTFYAALANGTATSIGLEAFQERTALEIVGEDGALLEELPPMPRFLNRILALRIAEQNAIFDELGAMIAARVAIAEAAGQLEGGAEMLDADSVRVLDCRVIRTCPATGAQTLVWRLEASRQVRRHGVDEMRAMLGPCEMLRNERSGGVAFAQSWHSLYDDDGAATVQMRLVKPDGREVMGVERLRNSHWRPCGDTVFRPAWESAVAALPAFEREQIALLSGLILPVWKHLPKDAPTIRRVRTDCGLSLIGRIIAPDALNSVANALGPLDVDNVKAVARAAMLEGRDVELMHGVLLRRRRLADRWRLELDHLPADWAGAIKAAGGFVEIIQYRARVFLPMTEALEDAHVAVLEAVLTLLPPRRRDEH